MIDYRIFEPDSDGKSKMEHVQDMLKNVEYSKKLTFTTVLMDAWYASNKMMLFISDMQKRFYCPIKSNRLARESGNTEYYKKLLNFLGLKKNYILVNQFDANAENSVFNVTILLVRFWYGVDSNKLLTKLQLPSTN